MYAIINLSLQYCAFSRYISCKRKSRVPAKRLIKIIPSYSSNFCNNIYVQSLICFCNTVHILGIFQGKESEAFLKIAWLKTLQIIAPSFATISVCNHYCLCKTVHFLGMFHAKESQEFLQNAWLKTLQIIAPTSAKISVCNH